MNNLEILKTGIENFGLEATEEKLQNLKKYREILVEWNKVMNLTGIEEEREVYIKHFLDSISAVTNNYINDDISLIDVGTGAGFPGMPLKICLDNLKILFRRYLKFVLFWVQILFFCLLILVVI